ncbi:2-oxoisovalerate dehydrogenase E2 component (dihydrolipoyl transacylase) [Microvirga flocculans]|uniref:Dihydrolipoamide acetyltransferase component of pyruvate dehydrogenase complex n=1 Tax=Microvirga flocculans TaxID=217168 RepID=A0A7W6IF43_9HYPH|nr:dihydrolipoamide acetyltransferase family protein [Microvirga flocculans]MBB4040328.1 2-oxoisovalerate dehydrogenase E2 component (dihydrolipoyl transacylase) [Microvirga flocculans]
MGEHLIKMPDVGEGIAEAELVEWHVKVGDIVREDAVLAAVMTDKATVEIPSPVDGEVVWLGADIGDVVAIGSPLIRLKVAGEGSDIPVSEPREEAEPSLSLERKEAQADQAGKASKVAVEGPARSAPYPSPAEAVPRAAMRARRPAVPRPEGEKPVASPAVRLRAREAGIDLRQVAGTGPAGRITHEDLDDFLARGPEVARASKLIQDTSVEHIKVIGLRRKIAEKMAVAKSRIPHITYVEEIDMTALEDLRAALNANRRSDRPKLTVLPFLMRAMAKAIFEQPHLNAIYDDEAGVVHQYGGVHIGIATQTASGLMVPVVRHVEARDIWGCAAELGRVTEAAKAGLATRDELTGSTITITSLGPMGGVVTTPVINHPEVAIIGVNKMMMRPVWDGATFIPRKMMNLSSSFDHRIIDGWDAAVFIQRIKTFLETPALIFVEA